MKLEYQFAIKSSFLFFEPRLPPLSENPFKPPLLLTPYSSFDNSERVSQDYRENRFTRLSCRVNCSLVIVVCEYLSFFGHRRSIGDDDRITI